MMLSQKLLFKVLQISLNIVGQVDTKIYSGDSYWSQGSVLESLDRRSFK